jgi:hypothetical protein
LLSIAGANHACAPRDLSEGADNSFLKLKATTRLWDRRFAFGERPVRSVGARLRLFRGRARSALGGQAAHQGRGAADGVELRQAAGVAARAAADKRGVTRSQRHISGQ